MATGTTTFDDLIPTIRDSMVRLLLERAQQDQVYMMFADKAKKDLHSGDRVIFKN